MTFDEATAATAGLHPATKTSLRGLCGVTEVRWNLNDREETRVWGEALGRQLAEAGLATVTDTHVIPTQLGRDVAAALWPAICG